MDEELTPTQEYYLLNENIYIPTKIDYRILVYLNLRYEILIKERTYSCFKYRILKLKKYTSNSVSTFNFRVLKLNEMKKSIFWKDPIRVFLITKEDTQKWIEANS